MKDSAFLEIKFIVPRIEMRKLVNKLHDKNKKMIIVSDKMMTPRTIDVITLLDKDGHYIYASRNIYDACVVLDYQNQNNVSTMEK